MYIFILLFLLSFFGTYFVMPSAISKLREKSYVVKDMYKKDYKEIPTNIGTIILFVSFISLAFLPFLSRISSTFFSINSGNGNLTEATLATILVVSIYSLYGLVDDLIEFNRTFKLVLPITFAFPLISVTSPSEFFIPFVGNTNLDNELFSGITLSDFFKVLIIPIYVMVVANLVNMHSGYNGLQSGLSIIILITLFLKSYLDGTYDSLIFMSSFIGSLLAFWSFNFYPARAFEGNVGSQLFGSLIGCIIVIQEYWWFGFFILLPHTFNFLLWVVWLYLMKKKPHAYLESDGRHKKFGKVSSDGTILVPNYLTLKWIPNYFYKINERNTVMIMYFITACFCISAILIF